jgi:hypothetical protein
MSSRPLKSKIPAYLAELGDSHELRGNIQHLRSQLRKNLNFWRIDGDGRISDNLGSIVARPSSQEIGKLICDLHNLGLPLINMVLVLRQRLEDFHGNGSQ